MSEENVEIVRAIETWNRRDLTALLAMWSSIMALQSLG
jgi:hypothetical protein